MQLHDTKCHAKWMINMQLDGPKYDKLWINTKLQWVWLMAAYVWLTIYGWSINYWYLSLRNEWIMGVLVGAIIIISSSIIHDDILTKQQNNLGLPNSNYFSQLCSKLQSSLFL
jgi:hypothetical protein